MNSLRSKAVFTKPRRFALLALLAIAWMQLSVAVHQFDHSTHAGTEACTVCIQLDRLDDVTVQGEAVRSTETIAAHVLIAHHGIDHSQQVRPYAPRAPPRF